MIMAKDWPAQYATGGGLHRREGTKASRAGTWILFTLVLVLSLSGCGPAWQATIIQPDGNAFSVSQNRLEQLQSSTQDDEKQPLPLEQVLYEAGHRAVERLSVIEPDGTRREFDWAAAADNARWLNSGRLSIGGEELPVARLEVQAPGLLPQVQASIIDIAPTAAAALGLPPSAQATGRVLTTATADHVLLLYLDGLGYVRYTEALAQGLIPNLAALPAPLAGMTTYPPATNVSTASLLTGASPEVHGVNRRGIRATETQTLFDLAVVHGRRVVAVEGSSLSFNLPNSEIQLSGDRDGNGSTDDNVLANALATLQAGMPDLLLVHFHGIDDAGHTYGPGAPEEMAAIAAEDEAVGQILEQVPSDTLVLIFADHGMHLVSEEGRQGNHGHLTERDMFIPIWTVTS
jgi:hypothetical protein